MNIFDKISLLQFGLEFGGIHIVGQVHEVVIEQLILVRV